MRLRRAIRKPIRLGLIGCGGIVQKTHGPCYRALGDVVRVVSLADPAQESRDAVGGSLSVPPERRYADHRQLLEEGEVDAVTVATPHNLHAEQVIAAAEAGVAAICEKPMALSMEEGQAIRDAVRRNGVPYALVHNLLFSAHMQAALSELKTGKLGEPFYGRAQSMFNRGARDSVPDTWWTRKMGGGGAILVTAWHEIYSVEALVGSPIRYVEGKVKTLLYAMDADDMVLLRFEHDNGALSTVHTSWCVPVQAAERGRWCEVHAPEGSLRVHHQREGPLLRYDRARNEWSEVELPALEQVDGLTSSLVGHVGYFAAVLDALAAGEETPVPVEQACHIMAVVEAARRSTVERRAVDVREVDTL